MKRVAFTVALLTTLGLAACHQGVSPTNPIITDPVEVIPDAVVQAVRTAYPTATNVTFTNLDKGKVWESRFRVAAVDHQAKINEKGTILEAYLVPSATGGERLTLPLPVTEYLLKTYPGFEVVAASEGQYNGQKSFKMLLRKGQEEVTLVTDEKGAVLLEYKATANAEAPKTYPIARVDELPAALGQYLRDNGLTFGNGFVSVDAKAQRSYFLLATKGQTAYELSFDESGKLLKTNSYTLPPVSTIVQTPYASAKDLPAFITDHLNATYKAWTFMKGYWNTENGKPVNYLIVVQAGSDYYYLYFNGEGKFEAATKG